MDEPTRRPADQPREDEAEATTDVTDGATPTTGRGSGGAGDPLGGVSQAEIDQAAALVGSRAERVVEELIEAELETGKREETIEEAKRHIVVRVIRIAAGVVVLILGLVLLAAPGPGLLVIALGLGLLAQDVPFARNLLDKVRDRLPQDEDGKLPKSTIVMMVVVSVAAAAGSLWFTFLRN